MLTTELFPIFLESFLQKVPQNSRAEVSKHFSIKGQIVNILGFVGQKVILRILWMYLYKKGKIYFPIISIEKIKNKIIIKNFFCHTRLLIKRMEFFFEKRGNTSLNWDSMFPIMKINCKFYLLMLICNEILHISSLKMSFYTDRWSMWYSKCW